VNFFIISKTLFPIKYETETQVARLQAFPFVVL